MRHLLLAAGVLTASAAHAESDFVLRAGEWETTVQIAGMPDAHPVVHHICHLKDHTLNAATMDSMMMHMKGTTCTKAEFNTSGDVTSYSFACTMGAMRMQMHGTITRDGPDAFTTRAMSHTDGGPMKIPDMDMTNAAHRVGPCQPGDTPEPNLEGGPS